MQDMLLKPGESLSIPPYPDLGLVVGETSPTGVTLTHIKYPDKNPGK
mgnify:CR=1 FL=1